MLVADRAHCSPWDLDDAPAWWVDRVRVAISAETEAETQRQRQAERQAKMRRAQSGHGGR